MENGDVACNKIDFSAHCRRLFFLHKCTCTCRHTCKHACAIMHVQLCLCNCNCITTSCNCTRMLTPHNHMHMHWCTSYAHAYMLHMQGTHAHAHAHNNNCTSWHAAKRELEHVQWHDEVFDFTHAANEVHFDVASFSCVWTIIFCNWTWAYNMKIQNVRDMLGMPLSSSFIFSHISGSTSLFSDSARFIWMMYLANCFAKTNAVGLDMVLISFSVRQCKCAAQLSSWMHAFVLYLHWCGCVCAHKREWKCMCECMFVLVPSLNMVAVPASDLIAFGTPTIARMCNSRTWKIYQSFKCTHAHAHVYAHMHMRIVHKHMQAQAQEHAHMDMNVCVRAYVYMHMRTSLASNVNLSLRLW